MRNPIPRGLIAAFLATVIEAASTPLQEYCVYANFSAGGSSYGGNVPFSISSSQFNSANWRSGQLSGQPPQSRLPQQWPAAPQARPTPRPFAPPYPSYYLRGGNSYGSNFQSPYFLHQQQNYRQRFIRDTLAQHGIVNDSEINWPLSDEDRPVSRNIIAGDPIEQKSWPFLVALLTTGDTIKIDNEYWDLVCGGTLIHPQFILTAAHCFVDEGIYTWKFMQASDFRVRIGDYNLLVPNDVPGAVDARVLRYTAHPRYDHKVVENGYDIALIQLDRAVQYSDWIKPACLPTPQNSSMSAIPPPNVPCQVAGWGAVNNAGRLSPIPRFTVLPSSRQSLCYNSLQVPTAARDGRLFCAGDLTGKKDSCSGDSGGPIFCLRENNAWELSGIVSFGGERCAQQSIPGAYTTISYFIGWIQSTMATMLGQGGGVSAYQMAPSAQIASRKPVLPPPAASQPPRFGGGGGGWQPNIPGLAFQQRNPPLAGVALEPPSKPSPSPVPAPVPSSNPTTPPPTASTQTEKSPAALLNLLQLLLNSFGGNGNGSPAIPPPSSIESYQSRMTTERYPIELDLP